MSEFIPWQSVGMFKFDDDIKHYQEILADWEFEPKEKYYEALYRSPDGNYLISLYHDTISAIFCYNNLTYKNTNLIGLTIDEFKHLTQSDYVGEVDVIDFEDDDYPQSVYEFESIGAQVWEKQGKIVTIIVAGKDSYSDEPYEE